jgi:acyl transferase domain-containing protein/acyl-CoA synthetase (AMP-forming)/AMP-acid ligase II
MIRVSVPQPEHRHDADVDPEVNPMSLPGNAVAALEHAAADYSTAGVVTVDQAGGVASTTYPQLRADAAILLGGLHRLGVRKGDVVVLAGLPLPDLFPALWACLLGGLTPLPVTDPQPEDLAQLCRRLDRPRVVTASELLTLRSGAPAAGPWHHPGSADIALLLLSSGSTGAAKIIPLTHGGLAAFAGDSLHLFQWKPGEVTLNWLPLDHSGALLLYHILPVFLGLTNVHVATEVVLEEPLRWFDLMAQYQVHHSWAPSFGYQLVRSALAERPEAHWDLSSVRSLVSGGEQITLDLVRGFLAVAGRFGIASDCFMPAWGMTETCTGITASRFSERTSVHRVLRSSMAGHLRPADPRTPDRECITFVAVGHPAPSAEIRLVDDDQRVLADRRIGRLQVRSPRITPGYLADETANLRAFPGEDRWFDTGDFAFIADGQVVITGRGSDVVIINGRNYLCHEIEELVGKIPGVREGLVAACGVPDARTETESLAVCFVPDVDRPSAADTTTAVRAALFARLRLTARYVVAVAADELPRTRSGKIRRADLARQVAARAETVPGTVRRVIQAATGSDAVDDETPFFDLGLGSVQLVRAHAQLQHAVGREFPVNALFEFPSIRALTAHLAGDTRAIAAGRTTRRVEASDRRIAVIGMSVRFPGARTVEEYWSNLRDGASSISTFGPEEMAASGLSATEIADSARRPTGGVLDDADLTAFDAAFFGMSPKEAANTHPSHRLFLECCYHALEDAGCPRPALRTGVYAGAGMNLYGHQYGDRSGTTDALEALQSSLGGLPDFLASRVAHRLGLTGPAVGVQTACSTSLVAVHLAVQALLTGDAELALAGAAAVHVPQRTGYRYHSGSMLSESGRCRPFDERADGTVGGNGVAVVVLKPLARAEADGDTVHAVIAGTAINNDGAVKVGFAAPSGPGQVDVVRQALDRAGVTPDALSYVEAHGTGTRLGDAVEIDALGRALGPPSARRAPCVIGSVKSSIGHLDSCSGLAGLVKVILMLRHRCLVPTVGLERPNSAFPLDGGPLSLATTRRTWEAGGDRLRAGVSSLGIGGTNAFVVVEQAPAAPVRRVRPVPVVVPLSGKSEGAVRDSAGALHAWLTAHPEAAAIDVAATMAARPAMRYRAAVRGRTAGELTAELTRPRVVETGEGGLAFVFSGQGRTYGGMAAHLYRGSSAARAVLDECETVLRETTGTGMLPVLLGESPLRSTRLGQPAQFAVQVAAVAMLGSFGVRPDYVAGHSIGEIAALCVAGALSIGDGIRVTARRGELMASRMAVGGMVAVRCAPELVGAVAATTGVVVAADNGADHCVIAGPDSRLRAALDVLERHGIRGRRLEVDRAFHSDMTETILPDLADAWRGVRFRPTELPVASTLHGRLMPAGTLIDAKHLLEHVRRPVLFGAAVTALTQAGCRRYLEIGPRPELATIGPVVSPDTSWTALQGTEDDEESAVLSALTELYRQGSPVVWGPLCAGGRRLPLPGYPFQRRPLVRTNNVRGAVPETPPSQPAAEGGAVVRPGEQHASPALDYEQVIRLIRAQLQLTQHLVGTVSTLLSRQLDLLGDRARSS